MDLLSQFIILLEIMHASKLSANIELGRKLNQNAHYLALEIQML